VLVCTGTRTGFGAVLVGIDLTGLREAPVDGEAAGCAGTGAARRSFGTATTGNGTGWMASCGSGSTRATAGTRKTLTIGAR